MRPREGVTMNSVVVVHFPDGSREFRFPEEPLAEGTVIWHEGRRYRVTHVETDERGNAAVTVEPDSDDLGDVIDDVINSERGAIQLVPVD
jgi:hypothetical protein